MCHVLFLHSLVFSPPQFIHVMLAWYGLGVIYPPLGNRSGALCVCCKELYFVHCIPLPWLRLYDSTDPFKTNY